MTELNEPATEPPSVRMYFPLFGRHLEHPCVCIPSAASSVYLRCTAAADRDGIWSVDLQTGTFFFPFPSPLAHDFTLSSSSLPFLPAIRDYGDFNAQAARIHIRTRVRPLPTLFFTVSPLRFLGRALSASATERLRCYL